MDTTTKNIFSKSYYDLKNQINDESNLDSLNKEQLNLLLNKAKQIHSEYKNFELIVKKDANSLYGTSASVYLSLVDFDVATDITQTGKHYSVLVDININKFFVNWGERELKIIQEFYPNCTGLLKFTKYLKDTQNDLCFYGDTDSRYIDLYMIYQLLENVDYPENSNDELIDFSLFLMDKFINNIIKTSIEKDVAYRNGNVGFLKMAHEVTTRKIIVQNKKKYVFACIWKDGKKLNSPILAIKGVELKKGELNPRIKKIIEVLVKKLIIENKTIEYIRLECIKLIRYIKERKEKDLIYKITSVSNLHDIFFNEQLNEYVSTKSHFSMRVAKSWYNFIHKNNLQNEYKFPFEGQKMNFYYDINDDVIGIPDDVPINEIKNLPEPNWNKMLNMILVKSILRYLKDSKTISDKDVEYFLMGMTDILLKIDDAE